MTIKIRGIIWLDSVIAKIDSKHGVFCEEVGQIFNYKAMFRFIEKGHRPHENVYAALGQTDTGRFLIVFFVNKKNHRVLILTARDMTIAERRLYEKK